MNQNRSQAFAKKKIAIFGLKYFPSRGGTSRIVEALLQELKDQYEFTVYCYEHPQAKTHIPGVKVVAFKETPIKGFGVFWFYLKCFWHLWRKGDHDLVNIHKIDAAFFAPLLSRKFRTLITAHALPQLNDKWSALGKRYFRFAEKQYMHPDAVQSVISQAHKTYFENRYGREVHFIPNGIDTHAPVSVEKAREILKTNQVNGNYLFFAARRIIPLKGLHTFLEALRQLKYDAPVVIAGDMDQMKEYSQRIFDLAEGLQTYFIGYIEDKATLLGLVQEADLFVFPSELEGMSIMLLEAANTDCPIVCSDIEANTHIFDETEVNFFPTESGEGLAAELKQVQENPELIRTKVVRAKAKVQKTYSQPAMARKYAELYNHLLAENRRVSSIEETSH